MPRIASVLILNVVPSGRIINPLQRLSDYDSDAIAMWGPCLVRLSRGVSMAPDVLSRLIVLSWSQRSCAPKTTCRLEHPVQDSFVVLPHLKVEFPAD
jgi:hypothetical protein